MQVLDLQVRECGRVGRIKREDDAVADGMQVSLHRCEIGKLAMGQIDDVVLDSEIARDVRRRRVIGEGQIRITGQPCGIGFAGGDGLANPAAGWSG